jgi:hypothetical protein
MLRDLCLSSQGAGGLRLATASPRLHGKLRPIQAFFAHHGSQERTAVEQRLQTTTGSLGAVFTASLASIASSAISGSATSSSDTAAGVLRAWRRRHPQSGQSFIGRLAALNDVYRQGGADDQLEGSGAGGPRRSESVRRAVWDSATTCSWP